MKMDLVANSGNDEFYTPLYAVLPIAKYLREGATIWCPFDKEESLFVRHFRDSGHTVIASHIENGVDFLSAKFQSATTLSVIRHTRGRVMCYNDFLTLAYHLQCWLVWSDCLKAKNDLRCLQKTNLRLCI